MLEFLKNMIPKRDAVFPARFYENPVLPDVKAFVSGAMDIKEFMEMYKQSDEIADYLDAVVDYIEKKKIPIRRRITQKKGVNGDKPSESRSYVESFIEEYAKQFHSLFEYYKNPPKVGPYLKGCSPLTVYEANEIHGIVADIYYQLDPTLEKTEKYYEEFLFLLDVLPGYLAGGVSSEDYVSRFILPKYPPSMKKGERKKMVREAVKQAFQRECKGYPRWIQSPEWPMGCDEQPMVYLGQKSFGEYTEYYFKDAVTKSETKVRQCY